MIEQLSEQCTALGVLDQGAISPSEAAPRDEGAAAVLQDLATIGEHVQGAGVRRVSRGWALVNQQRLDSVMRELADTIMEMQRKPKKTRNDLTSMAKLAHSFGYLSRQLTESQRLMLEAEKVSAPGETDAPKPPNMVFPAGAIVGPPPGGMLMKQEGQEPHGDQPAEPKPGA